MGNPLAAPTCRWYVPRLRFVVILMALLGLMPRPAGAQAVGLGAIIGSVTDASGGALPGVTLKLTSPALQVPASVTVSDDEGRYRFAELRIGVYRVEAVLDGFKTTVRVISIFRLTSWGV